MEISQSVLERYESNKTNKKIPPHEKAASVNEIIKVVRESKTYDYGYWLRKIGTASYSNVLDILKEAQGLDKKYNLGGFITNKLKVYAIPKSKPKRPKSD